MKTLITAFTLALLLAAGSTGAAAAGNEVKKCTGKLHACFKNNFDLLVDLSPTSSVDCVLACSIGKAFSEYTKYTQEEVQ
jgi:hypothetical protein